MSYPEFLEYQFQNWKTEPISKIYDCNENQNRTLNNNQEYMINYYWPGTIEGCSCQDRVLARECAPQQVQSGYCQRVGEYQSYFLRKIPIKIQNNKKSNIELCIQRQKGINYYDYLKLKKYQNCDSGNEKKIACSYGINKMCFIQGEDSISECPYNEIYIEDSQKNVSQYKDKVLFGLETMYLQNTGLKNLLVEIKITEGEGVCCRNNVSNRNKGRSQDYALLKTKRQVCEQIDKSFQPFLSFGEASYFNANGLQTTIQNLPSYYVSEEYTYSIYQRGYILWIPDCYSTEFDILDNLQQKFNLVKACFLVDIIVCAIFLLFLIVLNWKNILFCIKQNQEEREKNQLIVISDFQKRIKKRKIKLAGIAILGVTIFISFIIVTSFMIQLQIFQNKQCSTDYINEQLTKLKDDFLMQQYIFQISVFGAFLIKIWLEFVFYICMSQQEKELNDLLKNQMKQDKTVKINNKVQHYNEKLKQELIINFDKQSQQTPQQQQHHSLPLTINSTNSLQSSRSQSYDNKKLKIRQHKQENQQINQFQDSNLKKNFSGIREANEENEDFYEDNKTVDRLKIKENEAVDYQNYQMVQDQSSYDSPIRMDSQPQEDFKIRLESSFQNTQNSVFTNNFDDNFDYFQSKKQQESSGSDEKNQQSEKQEKKIVGYSGFKQTNPKYMSPEQRRQYTTVRRTQYTKKK